MPAPRNLRRPPDDPAELDAGLIDLVTTAWQSGWMPADLLAMIRHTCSARETRLAAALLLREHDQQGYGERLSPRWQTQLVEARSLARDVEATIAARPRGWRSHRTELWLALASLPPLRRLGPLPGNAEPMAERGDPGDASTARRAVDHEVLRKVRALLAKAESSPFEAEATAFTAKAQALITSHSLADALLSPVDGDIPDGPDARRLAVERPYDREKFYLLGAVAESNRCRAVLHSGLGLATVVGFSIDLDATELLFTSLLVQASHSMQHHGSTTDAYGNSTTRTFRRSFLTGFAGRVGERLSAETERATAQAAGAAEPDAPLLPVLLGRAEQVKETVGEIFPDLQRMRPSQATFDGSGYTAGVAAANKADLAARRPLAS